MPSCMSINDSIAKNNLGCKGNAPSAEFCRILRQNKVKFVFSGGMYGGENSSQSATVRAIGVCVAAD